MVPDPLFYTLPCHLSPCFDQSRGCRAPFSGVFHLFYGLGISLRSCDSSTHRSAFASRLRVAECCGVGRQSIASVQVEGKAGQSYYPSVERILAVQTLPHTTCLHRHSQNLFHVLQK